MDTHEAQQKLDTLFPDGARVVVGTDQGIDARIWITSRVLAVRDWLWMFSPLSDPHDSTLVITGEPEFGENSVSFVNGDGAKVRIDNKFTAPEWMKTEIQRQRSEAFTDETLNIIREGSVFSREDLAA